MFSLSRGFDHLQNVYINGSGAEHVNEQGGVTPIDFIVTAATAGQNFDWLSLAVCPLTD